MDEVDTSIVVVMDSAIVEDIDEASGGPVVGGLGMNDVERTVCSGWVAIGLPFGPKKVIAGCVIVTTTVSMGVTMIAADSALAVAVVELDRSDADCESETWSVEDDVGIRAVDVSSVP